MILFLKLFIAHLLGDFVFQSDKLVADKNKKKGKSLLLYIHALLHGALSMLLVWNWNFWMYALGITFAHFIIDLGKVQLQKEKYKREAFLIDQGMHFLIILVVLYLYQPFTINYTWLFQDQFIALYTAVLFLTKPSSVLIKIFISKWDPANTDKNSLQSAGNWIGILERLLIFSFILIGKWEAIGFLLAAKSVFRFGDLKGGTDRKLTEYILIGTLVSFGIAILTGIVYTYGI